MSLVELNIITSAKSMH